ncbi:alkaline phytoceramidase [Talaromyces proteolyticus]|uniref:Alkaline phytoceramidase n=1 Tax=Talaromyces proteolyticus TaxID=1131652 RepID=A0AAD4KNU7_9EURO|nr:alkaline phytoceramidase [Talaromyces proteolyticus]KAH8697103.1 alkaline phytoceramidase [Talaromyces proteolyticus]
MSHSVRHFSGDLYADAGVWSPSSSAANFCEEDYVVTIYIAEFINTLSNLAYIYYAFQYIYPRTRSPRIDLMSASLFLVGVCSFLFHATLHQETQFSDDLSMLFLAATLLQRLYCANKPAATARLITTAIFATVTAMSAYYVRSGDLVVHTSMFAGMLTLVWPRTVYLIHHRQGQDKAVLYGKLGRACGCLVFGFLLWNVDLEMCLRLRYVRSVVGLPWAWALELHGWWHLLTALGAAVYMDLIRDLCP